MLKQLFYCLSFFLFVLVCGCSSGVKDSKDLHSSVPEIQYDLSEIKERGVLNVVTTYSSTSYFLYRGQPMGYEYELLKRFAKQLEVDLHIEVSNNIENMFQMLNKGTVDLIAHGVTVTGKRKELVQFSDYLYLTRQVLVQKKPDNWRKMRWADLQRSLIHDPIDLIGDTVSVRANSSYIRRLENLSEEMGDQIFIDTVSSDLSTDRIIEMVADGKLKYTVADNNIAGIYASYNPILDIRVPVSFSQRMAWALRKNSPVLLEALNNWISEEKGGVAFHYIYNKYFKNERSFRSRENSEFYSLNHNRISEYDELIKVYADTLEWDWRLLSSLVYQESKFSPHSESWAGAKGLMQMMPNTAERFGVNDRSHPEQSLDGGTRMLKLLWNRFEDIPDSVQRIKFTMAAYNCGYSHVVDARLLAEEEGIDSYHWDNEVEQAILKLSYPENYNKPFIKYGYVRGSEPVNYVKEIFKRFRQYEQFIE